MQAQQCRTRGAQEPERRILVLGAEGIEESGTHDELLAKKGVYYRLWNQLPGEDTL